MSERAYLVLSNLFSTSNNKYQDIGNWRTVSLKQQVSCTSSQGLCSYHDMKRLPEIREKMNTYSDQRVIKDLESWWFLSEIVFSTIGNHWLIFSSKCLKLYLLVRALSWEGLVFFSIPTIPFPMPDLLINSRTLPLCFIFSYLYDYSEFFKHRFCFLAFPHNTPIFAHSKHLLLRFVLLLYFGLTF